MTTYTKSERIIWGFITAGMVVTFGFIMYYHDKQADITRKQVNEKWESWLEYRDTNCTITEKMFGISISSGKFQSNDNATIYSCTNGIKYLIPESIENSINMGIGNINYIPNI